jgi:hypothetical protein
MHVQGEYAGYLESYRPAGAKARQRSKIKEIGDALVASGFVTLPEQANALGLSRSTAWTLLRAVHKNSGLSAVLINRMLSVPQIPPLVRDKIVEYIQEKSAGLYGHRRRPLRRFTEHLSVALDANLRSAHAYQPS